MKKVTLFRHYLPCIFFIICAILLLWQSPFAFIMLLIFSLLLFIRHTIVRMAAGGFMLFLSIYSFLVMTDEAYRLKAGLVVTESILISVAFCMSILLIVPLQLPKRAPLYNRK